MLPTISQPTVVRRIGNAVEVHSGCIQRGRMPQLIADNDLLLLVGEPTVTVRCRGRADPLPPSRVSLVESGEVLVLELPEAAPHRAVYLAPGMLAELAGPVAALPDVTESWHRLAWVLAGLELCDRVDEAESENGLGRLAETVARSAGCRVRRITEERTSHAVIRRIRDHLREVYARKVMLEELAKMAGMCRYALVRAFTREIGMPPHAYQIHLRIWKARALIAAGGDLSDVSLQVGFSDQSHLHRHFRRIVGTTPGQYARVVARPRPERSR